MQVGQSELTELIFAKAQQNGTSPEQELQHMMEHDHAAEWMGEVRRGKALGELVAAAKIIDAEGNEIDLSRLNNDGTVSEPADDEADEAPAAAEEAADQTAETEQAPAEEAKPAAKKRTSKKAEAADEQAPAEDEKPAPKKRTTKKAEADKAEPVE